MTPRRKIEVTDPVATRMLVSLRRRLDVDSTSPEAVAAELRRLGEPVFRRGDTLGGSTASAREVMTAARRGGWRLGMRWRPAYVNRGRLLAAWDREDSE